MIEVFGADSAQPILEAEVGLRDLPPGLDPGNIGAFQREEGLDDKAGKAEHVDFNFCCWYVVDKRQRVMNLSILLDEQLVNVRSPYEHGPRKRRMSLDERQRRTVVARDVQYIPEGQTSRFLEGFNIS